MNDDTAAAQNPGMDSAQSEQLPALADRPLEEIEAVAEVLVEVRSVSSQLTADEVLQELSARLDRVGVRLPAGDIQELVDQLVPPVEGDEAGETTDETAVSGETGKS